QSMLILTEFPFTPEEVAQITAAAPGVDLLICQDHSEFLEKLPDAEVIYGSVDADILARAKNLRWVQAGAAGIESMAPLMREHSAVVPNFGGTFAPAISETAIGMLICLARGINRWYVPQFLARQWKPVGSTKSDHHVEISGRTMGIVGLGGIGLALARRAHYGFDMKILATDTRAIPRPPFVAELRDPGWLMEMVP